jgi:hypothetical protein
MVNLSYRLLCDFRQTDPEASILNLKAYCRGYKYVDEMIKMLPQKPEPILLAQILKQSGLFRPDSHRSTRSQPFMIGEGIVTCKASIWFRTKLISKKSALCANILLG